jgi:hypothetical protein
MRFLGKEKMEKLRGKLENSEKTESAFFYRIFVMSWQSFQEKKIGQLQRKVGKFGQTAKIIIFVCTFDRN